MIEKVTSTAPYLALALIVAGIGLVFWPRRSTPPLDTPAEPLAAPTTATVPPPPSAAGSEWPGASLGDEPSQAKPSWPDRRAERRAQRRGQSTVTFLTSRRPACPDGRCNSVGSTRFRAGAPRRVLCRCPVGCCCRSVGLSLCRQELGAHSSRRVAAPSISRVLR